MKRIKVLLGVAALAIGFALSTVGARPNTATTGAGVHFDAPNAAASFVEIVKDGEYTSKEAVAAYVRKFSGALPKNFITKRQARALGWQGGSLEPYAPGKSIGGDRFGNYERRLPALSAGFY